MLQEIHDHIGKLQDALANCGEKRYRQLNDEQRALFHAAFVTNAGDPDYHTLSPLTLDDAGTQRTMLVPKGDIFYQFRKDVNEGKLPAVSWLIAPDKFSDHPTSPWYGAWYVSEALDVLTSNPGVWKKTIFILTYDENDGYFDHAPSFVAADPKRPTTGGCSAGIDAALDYTYREDELIQGVNPKEARTGPIGLGFRVPMIVASPWTRGGWVNSQVFDHTSTLMLLERFAHTKFGKSIHEENISTWRRTVSGDLTSVFRPYDPKESKLNFLNRDEYVVSIEKARYKKIPANYRKLTKKEIEQINRAPAQSQLGAYQEEGIRPACALPYELYADGSLAKDGRNWELRLRAGDRVHGTASAGAPFNVYLRHLNNGKNMQAATFAVRAGDTLSRQFPLSMFAEDTYVIEVHGPNGFYRAFSGSAGTQEPIEVRTVYEGTASGLTGNVQVNLHNPGKQIVFVVITDEAYGASAVSRKLKAGEDTAIVLPLRHSNGWYDFTVKCEGSNAQAHYAGRVETGQPSTSDLQMGRKV